MLIPSFSILFILTCPYLFCPIYYKLSIHYKIRPRTLEHNGKVERNHRNDNERFYSYLKFYSLEDLIKQGMAYLKRTNNILMAVLGYLTPKEKREKIEARIVA